MKTRRQEVKEEFKVNECEWSMIGEREECLKKGRKEELECQNVARKKMESERYL